MAVKMTCYKHSRFPDEDSSSVGSLQIHETTSSVTAPPMTSSSSSSAAAAAAAASAAASINGKNGSAVKQQQQQQQQQSSVHIRYHSPRRITIWQIRSKLEKCLITTIILLLILSMTLIGLLLTNDETNPKFTSNTNTNTIKNHHQQNPTDREESDEINRNRMPSLNQNNHNHHHNLHHNRNGIEQQQQQQGITFSPLQIAQIDSQLKYQQQQQQQQQQQLKKLQYKNNHVVVADADADADAGDDDDDDHDDDDDDDLAAIRPQSTGQKNKGTAAASDADAVTVVDPHHHHHHHHHLHHKGMIPRDYPCVEESCVHAASDILHSIDPEIDPCEDFYQYSCNKWIKNNPLPEDKPMWGTFGKLEQRNQIIIKNVLEQEITKFKSEAERKAKYYYESCLDVNGIVEKIGAQPMLDLIDDIGGWNISSNSSSSGKITNWSFTERLKRIQRNYNVGALFNWGIGEDDRHSTRNIIQIDQGGLSLPGREQYLNRTAHSKILDAYLEYMIGIGVLLGGGKPDDIKQQMIDIIEFETKLANITVAQEERRDEEQLYKSMTLEELQLLAPYLNWTEHFNDAFQLVNVSITDQETVVVYGQQYLANLTEILEEYQQTDEGIITLNNYLVWQTVRSFTSCLSKAFREAYKGLRKALMGADGQEETWRYCISDTNNIVGFALGSMFVREQFHGESKPFAEQMIQSIRESFKLSLLAADWMDEETRRLAIEKANGISDMIGFPEYILDAHELDRKYKDLEINATTYFQNNIRANQFNLRKTLEKLNQPVNKTKWGMTPQTVNAYYTPTKNQMVFPAGILQLPFYDIRNPKSLNFGAMGVVMGHELTHAFDDQGREYDKNGNLHRWWNNQTIDRFKEHAKCFEDQYGNFRINNLTLNGKQTLGENIADNGGLKAAYNAFINLRSNQLDNVDLYLLPGVKLNHRQLFFVGFAQVWCSAITDESTKLQIEKDPHSPPKFRVNGPISNFPEFSNVFNCKLGSPMNPINKCKMW